MCSSYFEFPKLNNYPSLVACEASAAASSIWRHSSLFDMEGSRRSSLLDLFCCLAFFFGLLDPKKQIEELSL